MKIADFLSQYPLVGIETAPFIYYVERHPTYFDRVRPIIQAIRRGDIRSTSAALTLTEVLTLPLRMGNVALARRYQRILYNSRNFALIAMDRAVARRTASLRARYNLKTPDAIHVATAIHTKCDVFLTNDIQLKRVTEIAVVVVDELQP